MADLSVGFIARLLLNGLKGDRFVDVPEAGVV